MKSADGMIEIPLLFFYVRFLSKGCGAKIVGLFIFIIAGTLGLILPSLFFFPDLIGEQMFRSHLSWPKRKIWILSLFLIVALALLFVSEGTVLSDHRETMLLNSLLSLVFLGTSFLDSK